VATFFAVQDHGRAGRDTGHGVGEEDGERHRVLIAG
jgi:hypothetical protein